MKPVRQKIAKVPYFKMDKEYEPLTVPTFQSRRTLASHQKDNMSCCGRRSFYQRIVLVAKHKIKAETHKFKDPFMGIIKELYKYSTEEMLGGLMVGNEWYSFLMVEGSDLLVGNYLKLLSKVADTLYENSRVVLIYNNINQRFLGKMVYRVADLPEETSVTQNKDENISTFLRKVYLICHKIREEEADEGQAFKSIYLPTEVEHETPDIQLMDFILKMEHFQTIQEFASVFGNCESMLTYVDDCWPIQNESLPIDMFEWGKYDVNLTFGDQTNNI